MKKQFILAIMAATMMTLGACGNEEEVMAPAEGAQVNFVIDGTVTRTVTDAVTGVTSFKESDEITIYSTGLQSDMEGAVFTVGADGILTSKAAATYNFNGVNGASFYAYYPTSATGTTDNATFTVPANQSNENAFNNSDFMTSTSIVNAATEKAISLSFKHRLTLVKVVLNGFTNDTEIKMNNIYPTTTWTYSNDAMATDKTGSTIDITMWKNTFTNNITSVTEYWAIVPEQTVAQGTTLFTITADGKQYAYTPSASNVTFTANTAKKFTLSLGSNENVISLKAEMNVQWGTEENNSGNAEEIIKNYIVSPSSIETITKNRNELSVDKSWGFFDATGNANVAAGVITVETTTASTSWYNRTLYYYSTETLVPGEYTLSFSAKTSSISKNVQISLVSANTVPETSNYNFCQIIPAGGNSYTGCPQTITNSDTEYSFTINTNKVVVNTSTGGSPVTNFTDNTNDIAGFYLAIAFQAETFSIHDIKLVKK